jgi:hypothetical protein
MMNVAEIYCISLRRYVVNDIGIYCIPVRWYLMIDTEVFCIPIRRYLISDAEAYCILISDTETFTHTYKLIPGCAHTNILISDKWVLSGMNVQKTDAKRIVPTETISIEPYAGEPVSKHPDSEYEYVDAIESA